MKMHESMIKIINIEKEGDIEICGSAGAAGSDEKCSRDRDRMVQ